MKILITAMAAMAETGGPVSRSIALAKYLKNEGHQVANCIAEDVNYKEIDGIKNYYLDIPMPMGNSVVQGLQYGVPQLIVPGKVFERKFNAKSISDKGAAIEICGNN